MDSDNVNNTNTYNLQTNAFYTILSNDDVIPNDYVQAQNCITSHSQYMDSFAALKSMLSTVHQTLPTILLLQNHRNFLNIQIYIQTTRG